jgi:uncharacterized protein
MGKKTLVIGASTNQTRYSYLAINKLLQYNHEVVAIASKPGAIKTVEFATNQIPFSDVDTVTLYINPQLQIAYYNYIFSLHPKRIIFNPGTENAELAALAKQNNIVPIEACTLVLLSTGQY